MAEFYTTKEAAAALGICTARVLQLRREGVLDAYSRGETGSKSKFYFKVADVEYYKEHRDDPKPVPPLRKVES